MKNNLILKHVSNTSRIFMTLLIILLLFAIVQVIIVEISRTFVMSKYWVSQQASQKPVEDEITRIKKSSKHFMPDGTVHQLVYEKSSYRYDDAEKKVQIYDVNDNLIWQGLKEEIPYQYLSWRERLRARSDTFDEQQMHRTLTVTPGLSGSIEFPVRQNDEIEIIWRYIPDKEYFVAYDTQGGITGYIGASRFADTKSNVKSFGRFKVFTAWCPEDSINPVMLWQTDKKIYQIDFQKQTVELIFESDQRLNPQMLLKDWRFVDGNNVDGIEYRPAILCETVDGDIKLIMRGPEQIFSFSPPEHWELKEQYVKLTATDDGIYVLRGYNGPRIPEEYRYSEELSEQWWNECRSKPLDRWVELYRIDESSGLSLLNRYEWSEPPHKVINVKAGLVGYVKYYTNDFSPPVYAMIWQAIEKYWSEAFRSENDSIFSLWVAIIGELRPRHYILNWCLSFVVVLLALWHGYSRRANWIVVITWFAIVVMFNVAGFLTYWGLNHTPVIKCSACGKKRHLQQPKCVHCGSDLPNPQPKTTDLIFAA